MSGRIGDLSQQQSDTLAQFKVKITELKMYDPAKHDDHMLLRFLRARKFDLVKTVEMWSNCMKWREEKKVDEIYETFKFEEAEKVHEIYPRFYHKCDKEGRPVYYEVLGKLDLEKLFKITTRERMEMFFIYEYERLIRQRLPACSKVSGKNVETTMTVLDLANCSVMQGMKIRDLLQLIIQMGQNYYPETMGMTFIINAPWLFDTIWNIVKHMMDEVTVKKIQIFKSGKDYKKALFELVEPENVPSSIGGTSNCPEGCSDIGPWNK